MHLAQGLEFRAAVIAACDDDVILTCPPGTGPLQTRVEAIAAGAGLEDV